MTKLEQMREVFGGLDGSYPFGERHLARAARVGTIEARR
jgi:hypothetical protein